MGEIRTGKSTVFPKIKILKHNKHEETNNLSCGKIIAHDRRYMKNKFGEI